MSKPGTIKDAIQKAIKLISESSTTGIRWNELNRKLKEAFPEISESAMSNVFTNLRAEDSIYRPVEGLYKDIKYKEAEEEIVTAPTAKPQPKIDEKQFYQPFAIYLVNELEECTEAIAWGGNKFKDKWSTPDVIGKLQAKEREIYRPTLGIISAEIKTAIDPHALIEAFGQTCAYKLFSHRSYLVVPGDSSEEDKPRLDALARIFGIGLVLFDRTKPENPNFQIRVRASRHEPDMFYVNKYAKYLEGKLF